MKFEIFLSFKCFLPFLRERSWIVQERRLDNPATIWRHLRLYVFSFKTYFTGQADCWKTLECTIDTFTTGKSIYHFRNEKRTGAEMRPAIKSGILTTDAPLSYWPMCFPVPINSPRSLCESKLGPVSFSWRILHFLYSWFGSLSNDDSDVNENGKIAIGSD